MHSRHRRCTTLVIKRPLVPTLPAAGGNVAMGHNPGGMYPQLNAPLYPSPQPNTPTYVGGTYITNQALAPHEMLYPHDYHAMYGPYYWRVKGSWILTPFGVRSHEKWQLQGTEVRVKYRSQKPFLSGFCPPAGNSLVTNLSSTSFAVRSRQTDKGRESHEFQC